MIHCRRKFSFILFILISITLFAEEPLKPDKQYFQNYLRDTKNVFTSPLHWQSSDWVKAGLATGITIGLYNFADQNVREEVQKNRSDFFDTFANGPRLLGDGLFILGSQSLLYVYGASTDNSKLKRATLLSLESYVISGGIIIIMKSIGQRHRPYKNDGSDQWDGPSLSLSNKSFPSGHSASAFAVATVFASVYKDVKFVPVICYSLASMAALSRVYDDVHWASDIFFGSVVGYFTAKSILKSNSEENDLTIFPSTDGNDIYLNCSIRF